MRKIIIILIAIFFSFSVYPQSEKHLVILHLNDIHSRIEPLPESDPDYPGKGGMARIEACFRQAEASDTCVLKFVSGDFVQGTPYFNLFRGNVEVGLLNKMKIDAVCLGNHEFDFGLSGLKYIVSMAEFPVLASNYDFSATALKGMIKKYVILEKCGLKIGVFGIVVDPKGLIAVNNYKGVKYLDPVKTAEKTAAFLKEKEKCDLVICLSHFGYFSKDPSRGDIMLAEKTKNIDILLGGHTHTFLPKADRRKNSEGKEVVIAQMGWRGVYVGRMDVYFKEIKK